MRSACSVARRLPSGAAALDLDGRVDVMIGIPPSHRGFVMRFDAFTKERLRRHLLHRGGTLATLLADVLAGKNKQGSLAALGILRPGMRPDEALRDALGKVEARRRLLVADDERYGCCDVCGLDLGLVALDQMPWADRCTAHGAL